MSGKDRKSSTNKTINFAERKKSINSKQVQQTSNKAIVNDNRVIQYDINKMREQINQQTKKKSNPLSKFKAPIWVKALYFVVILLFVILLLAKFTNNFGLVKRADNIPMRFEYMSSKLDTEDTIKIETLLDNRLKSLINSNDDINVSTTSMHKNDKYVFANGYFTYPNDSDKIFFDAVIVSDKVQSIVVNGYDLIQKKEL